MPTVWVDIPGGCTNPYTVEGVRPPPCGFDRFRCVDSTPCDQNFSNAVPISFSPAPGDCNQNGVPDVCDAIPGYLWTGTVGGTNTDTTKPDVVGGEGQTFSFISLRRDDSPGTAVAPTGEVVYTGNFSGTGVDLNPLENQQDIQSSNGGSNDGFLTNLKRLGAAPDASDAA